MIKAKCKFTNNGLNHELFACRQVIGNGSGLISH